MTIENPRTTKILIIIICIVIIIGLAISVILTFVLARRARLATNDNPCQSIPPPTNLETITVDVVKIQVTWTKVRQAVRYRVYVGTVPGFNRSNAIEIFTTGDPNYTILGMVLGRSYYIRVSALNTCGSESVLSPQNTVRLVFPRRFLIVSRQNPNLALRVGNDFETIIVDNRCSGTANNDSCVWQYDSDNALIQSASNPLICMKSLPTNIDVRVKYGDCSVFPYSNSYQGRQWIFDTRNGSICNPQNQDGYNCIRINGPAIAGQSTIRIPFDNSPSMQWDIVSL